MSQQIESNEANSIISDTNNSLNELDKSFCDRIFAEYITSITGINNLIEDIRTKNRYFNLYKSKQLFYVNQLSVVEAAVEKLEAAKGVFTISLAYHMESYFSNKYALQFNSICNETFETKPEHFSSYIPILDNIICQTGTDFQQSGKEQIIQRFRNCFSRENPPSLKGATIILPNFFTRHEPEKGVLALHYADNKVERLYNSFNSFLKTQHNCRENMQRLNMVYSKRSNFPKNTPYTLQHPYDFTKMAELM